MQIVSHGLFPLDPLEDGFGPFPVGLFNGFLENSTLIPGIVERVLSAALAMETSGNCTHAMCPPAAVVFHLCATTPGQF